MGRWSASGCGGGIDGLARRQGHRGSRGGFQHLMHQHSGAHQRGACHPQQGQKQTAAGAGKHPEAGHNSEGPERRDRPSGHQQP
ncbi:MAG: hypothetical protein ACK56I_02380, partial [bacterium]